MDLLSIYAPGNRAKMLVLASFLTAAIAVVDWWATHYISLGFLYLFPIIIFGGFLSRTRIVGVALLCAMLQEIFSNLPTNGVVILLLFSSVGFVGTGLFISEMVRNRRIVLKHSEELSDDGAAPELGDDRTGNVARVPASESNNSICHPDPLCTVGPGLNFFALHRAELQEGFFCDPPRDCPGAAAHLLG